MLGLISNVNGRVAILILVSLVVQPSFFFKVFVEISYVFGHELRKLLSKHAQFRQSLDFVS